MIKINMSFKQIHLVQQQQQLSVSSCNCPSVHAVEKIELLAEACHTPVS